MKYDIQFAGRFNSDSVKLRENEPKYFEKVLKFIDELKEHPRTGTGHPEQLKHYKEETWSRTISKKHRLVYEIHDDLILVIALSAYGHYDDK